MKTCRLDRLEKRTPLETIKHARDELKLRLAHPVELLIKKSISILIHKLSVRFPYKPEYYYGDANLAVVSMPEAGLAHQPLEAVAEHYLQKAQMIMEQMTPEVSRQIAQAARVASNAIERGGRVFLCGAGSVCGALLFYDAGQLRTSYGFPEGKFIPIPLAPGNVLPVAVDYHRRRQARAGETPVEQMPYIGLEEVYEREDSDEGIEQLKSEGATGNDVLIAMSASGGTKGVIKTAKKARELGMQVISITNNRPGNRLSLTAQIAINVWVGPPAFHLATRMEQGLAAQQVLQVLTQCMMVDLGYLYEMKLGLDPNAHQQMSHEAEYALSALHPDQLSDIVAARQFLQNEAHGNLRAAQLMLLRNIDYTAACTLLGSHQGNIRRIMHPQFYE